MANIGHNHVNEVGSSYDATSDASVSGWVKLPETDAADHNGQSNSDGGWKQT